MDIAFEYNLSCEFFKRRRLHEAVERDPYFCDVSHEWSRTVRRNCISEAILCCPEDVRRSVQCQHGELEVCWKCEIPICNECFTLLRGGQKIPKALANDNFISYQHRYIVENRVTWLEATISTVLLETSGSHTNLLMRMRWRRSTHHILYIVYTYIYIYIYMYKPWVTTFVYIVLHVSVQFFIQYGTVLDHFWLPGATWGSLWAPLGAPGAPFGGQGRKSDEKHGS